MKFAIISSLVLSILHSVLFYGQNLGISVFLFAIVGVFIFIEILRKNEKIKNKKPLLLSVPIILLSATYFLFNNEFFNNFNMLVIIILFLIMIIWSVLGKLQFGRIIENICVLIFGSLTEVGGAAREISNNFSTNKKEIIQDKKEKVKNKKGKQILKGVLISLPLLIVIIVLLVSADEMFANIIGNIFGDLIKNIVNLINVRTIYSILFRIIIITLLTIYFISFILNIKNDKLDGEEFKNKKGIKIDGTILNTVLTLVNVVYLLFSATQIIQAFNNITNGGVQNYSTYARTGFFQLMAVSFINFAIIFISKNNKNEENNKNYTKTLNVWLAIFTVVILISSVLKMNLYAAEYGYTFLRIAVYFIQVTELILIVPTIIYILKEKFDILSWYITIIVTMYVILNFSNVDYIIAKKNIDKYFNETDSRKAEIDIDYLISDTSTDAISQIKRLLDVEDNNIKTKVNNYLWSQKQELLSENKTWQSFNLSKYRAKKELENTNVKSKMNLKINDFRSNEI